MPSRRVKRIERLISTNPISALRLLARAPERYGDAFGDLFSKAAARCPGLAVRILGEAPPTSPSLDIPEEYRKSFRRWAKLAPTSAIEAASDPAYPGRQWLDIPATLMYGIRQAYERTRRMHLPRDKAELGELLHFMASTSDPAEGRTLFLALVDYSHDLALGVLESESIPAREWVRPEDLAPLFTSDERQIRERALQSLSGLGDEASGNGSA